MLGKITKTAVEGLAPGQWLWDHDHREVVKGFGARRQVDGVFYYLRFRLNGRQIIKSLGRHGHLTPDTARTKAKQKLGKVASGVDPFAEEAKARTAETFGDEAKRYLERKQPSMKRRSYGEVQRHLMNHAKPLHRSRLSEINRRDIARLLEEIETGSGVVTRNRVRSSLGAFFTWAMREGFIEVNSVSGTGQAHEGGSRERVLTQSELAELWAVLEGDKEINRQYADVVRLLILTGQRREEIGSLRWNEVDFDRGLIVLPPARTKNKRQHELPLSPQTKAILERQPRRKDQEFVFSNANGGGFCGWSNHKERLDTKLASNGASANGNPWRVHDFRRTAATGMAELGVLPHIIEAVLNHVSGHKSGVAGIYNRARYEGEMREALKRWADHVERICGK